MTRQARCIYHIALVSELRAGSRNGSYTPLRFESDGFVGHAETPAALLTCQVQPQLATGRSIVPILCAVVISFLDSFPLSPLLCGSGDAEAGAHPLSL